jgi:hypothetical protein
MAPFPFTPQLQESGAERERALMMGYIGIANQGESRGERGYSACAAKIDLRGEADVRPPFSIFCKHLSRLQLQRRRVVWEKRVWEGGRGKGNGCLPRNLKLKRKERKEEGNEGERLMWCKQGRREDRERI